MWVSNFRIWHVDKMWDNIPYNAISYKFIIFGTNHIV